MKSYTINEGIHGYRLGISGPTQMEMPLEFCGWNCLHAANANYFCGIKQCLEDLKCCDSAYYCWIRPLLEAVAGFVGNLPSVF